MESIKKINLKNKTVLLRVDFNVPLDDKGDIISDFRIQKNIKTIKYLLTKKAKVILMSHLGRPKGTGYESKLSLEYIGFYLSCLLNKKVAFVPKCIGEDVKDFINKTECEIVLLENLRFHKEEVTNDKKFAKSLAYLGDIYVNNAFSVAHRKHASVHAITKYIPSYQGLVMEEEIKFLEKISKNNSHPFVLVVGGQKIKSKINPIMNLGNQVDCILIGGALANTFLKAQEKSIGKSLYLPEEINLAKKILKKFKTKIILPTDFVIATTKNISDKSSFVTKKLEQINSKDYIFDIGDKTIKCFKSKFKGAKKIFWAGPLGVFEVDATSKGTFKLMTNAVKEGKVNVFAGGETISALEQSKNINKATYVSTGGSSALEFISGKKLPAIEVLKK